jgi:phage terminase small subunit
MTQLREVHNPKQQRFIQEYPIDFNAERAAIAAGYSPNFAGNAGRRLLKKASVQTAIETRLEEIAKESTTSALWVIEKLKKVHEVCSTVRLSKDESHKVMYDPSNAIKALELIGKYHKMFTDKVEQTVDIVRINNPVKDQMKEAYDVTPLVDNSEKESITEMLN